MGTMVNRQRDSQLGSVIDGAEKLLAATADLSESKLVSIRSSLEKDLEAARTHLEDLEAALKARATSVDTYVHQKPWQAIGVAAGAGIVTGAVLGAVAFRKDRHG